MLRLWVSLLLATTALASESREHVLAVSYWAERGWNTSSTMLVGAGPDGMPYEENVAIRHTRYLNCSIRLLRERLVSTPLHFYIFAPHETVERDGPLPSWLRAPDVTLVLTEPPHSTEESNGSRNRYIEMGAWRLVPQFKHLRNMGHRYVLQTDDDALVHRQVDENIISLMEGKYMGGYCRKCFVENGGISGGGAELMAFYLKSFEMTPAGPLLSHCKPPNMTGLHSLQEDGTGWTPYNLAGNWNLFDLDFWFRKDVQIFVDLVRASHMIWKRRWNELMPQSMIAEMFVPDEKFLVLDAARHYSFRGGIPEMCYSVIGVSKEQAVKNLP